MRAITVPFITKWRKNSIYMLLRGNFIGNRPCKSKGKNTLSAVVGALGIGTKEGAVKKRSYRQGYNKVPFTLKRIHTKQRLS
jgi:hypothetical protein